MSIIEIKFIFTDVHNSKVSLKTEPHGEILSVRLITFNHCKIK